jgi:hypothetical protein
MTLLVRQIAYFCADVRAAALAHHAQFGSGPYFVADNIPLARAVHRGIERPLDHSSAYGQWGEVMIEFVQQNNPGPSPFHDLFPEGSGRYGLHHLAVWVEDVDAALASFATAGSPTALRAEMKDGFVFAFADTSAVYGHMTELYAPVPALTGFYKMVADAARDYRGGDVLTTIRMG